MNLLEVITDKQHRNIWLRAFHIWQRKPHEVVPLSQEIHRCYSCGTEFQGNFCPRCGQSAKIGRFSFKKALLLFLDVWGVGNRGMFRSIRDLMLRPGYMIRDYLRGMQSAYFPPFKMFFLLTALSYAVDRGLSFEVTEAKDQGQGWKIENMEVNGEKVIDNSEKFENRLILSANSVGRFINNLRKKNAALFSLLSLLLFFTPMYLFFRHSPTIPDLRFSEYIVALVYTSNAYSIYDTIAKLLSSGILHLLAFWVIFITIKQLSGYPKKRVLGYMVLTFFISLIILALLASGLVFSLTFLGINAA